MNRAVVALLVSVSMLGCFPHNARNRTIAKATEGGAILAGIAISAFANTGADCDMVTMVGVDESGCHNTAQWASTAGVALIVGGLLGFVATVSTEEDDGAKPKPVEIKEEAPQAQTKPAEPKKSTTQATDPNAAGSAALAPSAPQR
jgi:hypothetical protein